MAARMNSASSDKTPYEEMVAEEQARAIREAIDSLPAEYSKPIKLYYFEDNSFDEISKKLGISTTAVSSRIQYARKMLKNKLPKDMFKALILYFESVELLNK
jgi:RNA polymerase sigma-70 factor (ECF subfamily)